MKGLEFCALVRRVSGPETVGNCTEVLRCSASLATRSTFEAISEQMNSLDAFNAFTIRLTARLASGLVHFPFSGCKVYSELTASLKVNSLCSDHLAESKHALELRKPPSEAFGR